MPEVVCKSIDVARTMLARGQRPVETSFEVIGVVEPGCTAKTICKISPGRKQRKQVRMQGRIYVGLPQPHAATPPPTVDATDPPPPATTPPPAAKPDTYFCPGARHDLPSRTPRSRGPAPHRGRGPPTP